MVANDYTIHGGWVLTLLRLVDDRGIDGDALLARAGLGQRASISPGDRIPFGQNKLLWDLAEQETGDPCIGLSMGQYFGISTFHALGMALLSSGSLFEALTRLVRFGKVLGTAGQKSLYEVAEGFCFQLIVYRDGEAQSLDSYASIDAFFSVLVSVLRVLYSPGLNPIKVELVRPRPAETIRFEEFFKAPITFSSSENRIFFDRASILAPIITGDTELTQQIELLLSKRLASCNKQDVVDQVRGSLVTLLLDGTPTEAQVADSLHLGCRTLQRKLRDSNRTYSELLADTKKQLACQYLQDPKLSINEIAFLLGYSEETNFARAFKRWTGSAPGEYRKIGSAIVDPPAVNQTIVSRFSDPLLGSLSH